MFSDYLSELVQKLGSKQKEVARRMGIDESMLSAYVNGNRMPNAETVLKMAELVGSELGKADAFQLVANWLREVLGVPGSAAAVKWADQVINTEPTSHALREAENSIDAAAAPLPPSERESLLQLVKLMTLRPEVRTMVKVICDALSPPPVAAERYEASAEVAR